MMVCPESPSVSVIRAALTIQGLVQGVGFRPYVYRLANALNLAGTVKNQGDTVYIEVQGPAARVEMFIARLPEEAPPQSDIAAIQTVFVSLQNTAEFQISPSDRDAGQPPVFLLPDLATCDFCRQELFNPSNRRYRYPFITCTHCGPRYSIMTRLPYDRPHTTMAGFPMCPACREEYKNPENRRFHAQPIACEQCGPKISWQSGSDQPVLTGEAALQKTLAQIREGNIVAVKGIGGFHLLADARNHEAVTRLRKRKHRPAKPFALLVPSLANARQFCHLTPEEERILNAVQAPIVLLRRRANTPEIAESVAPGNPYLGLMLPYTPLHHLIMAELRFPVVATSGNFSEEPLCYEETDALIRLADIADGFLSHNRPIAAPVEDSVVQVIENRVMVLRLGRGYAPLSLKSPLQGETSSSALMALGGHLKNTIALAVKNHILVSPHIGDLDEAATLAVYHRTRERLGGLLHFTPAHFTSVMVATDKHPDYQSTQTAQDLGYPTVAVQHHLAHILSCLADNQYAGPCVGLSWDGTGYGDDQTIWGGEALLLGKDTDERNTYHRLVSLLPFPLLGGEAAIREPKRAALGLLYTLLGEVLFEEPLTPPLDQFSAHELALFGQMLRKGLQTPMTSSMGRLFDAVASLLGVCHVNRFEGDAAMALEYCQLDRPEADPYPFLLNPGHSPAVSPAWTVDWRPMLAQILEDRQNRVSVACIAARFHGTLAEIALEIAKLSGQHYVALTGGCFQNRSLLRLNIQKLRDAGFTPLWHQRVPPNDGGLSVGQIVAAIQGYSAVRT